MSNSSSEVSEPADDAAETGDGGGQGDGVDRLEPALVYHLVNTLGWHDLRPLQKATIPSILEGEHTLVLAPTAGGKTEAALFPMLSRMAEEAWPPLSVLYVCPLRALLNNLHPRVERYASFVGRRAGLWHGDVGSAPRRRMVTEPPDILLTTPESIEAMLISTRVDHRYLFANVRAVVVDEIHAFAGDDRGWHLLAVLERVAQCAGNDLQRIGLSATVGNPDALLGWLRGASQAPSHVVSPGGDASLGSAARDVEIEVDHVGGVANAATLISRLHLGEKRLVFCDSKAIAEQLTAELRQRDVTTFISHAALSREERHQAEQAFTEASNCVIVATSTLELGVDVGDLDRVIQIGAPNTVAPAEAGSHGSSPRQSSELPVPHASRERLGEDARPVPSLGAGLRGARRTAGRACALGRATAHGYCPAGAGTRRHRSTHLA